MNEGTTHHGTCWRVHPECAQARMREIEEYVLAHADKVHADPLEWWRGFWSVFRGERKGYKNPMTYLVHEYGIPVRLPVQLAADVGLLQLWESTYRTVRLEPDERRTRITRAVVRMEMEAGR